VQITDQLLSFEGRLSRERWLGSVSLLVMLFVVVGIMTYALHKLNIISLTTSDRTRTFCWFMLMVPWLALDWKRFQDRGRWGAFALICPLAQCFYFLAASQSMMRIVGSSFLVHTIMTIQLFIGAWYAYELAYKKGDEGYNAYGAQPVS
jgi:uncharacterized membrane protein YhaH (DUF805 family)